MGSSQAKSATSLLNQSGTGGLDISKNLQGTSLPWLNQAGNYFSSIASGDPAKVAGVVGPQVDASRAAYDQAQQQIMRTVPKGGFRDQSLTNLNIGRAGDISRITSGGLQQALQELGQLGTGGTQLSLSGLGTAAQSGQSLASLSQAKAQAFGSGIAGLGGGVGSLFGGLFSNPNFH